MYCYKLCIKFAKEVDELLNLEIVPDMVKNKTTNNWSTQSREMSSRGTLGCSSHGRTSYRGRRADMSDCGASCFWWSFTKAFRAKFNSSGLQLCLLPDHVLPFWPLLPFPPVWKRGICPCCSLFSISSSCSETRSLPASRWVLVRGTLRSSSSWSDRG